MVVLTFAGLFSLLFCASSARSEEPRSGGSCNARVDVWQSESKKSNFSKKTFRYKARVRSNTRECTVVEWQLSWDYHRQANGRLEKDTMLMKTTIERGDANANEEGEVQEDTGDPELNFRAEEISCRLCEESSAPRQQGRPKEHESREAQASADVHASEGRWITDKRTKCRVWNPHPKPNESITWSGECKNGFAQGHGIVEWFQDGKSTGVSQGEWRNGYANGHGVDTLANGDRFVG